MKYYLLVILTFLLIKPICYSQENVADTKSKAVIMFEKTTYDYGNIPQKGDGTCEFVFKNTGKAPLILSNVKSSCGCTVPEWPKKPIMPKKTGVIKVKYNTARLGNFQKSITVFSNAKNSPVVLSIKGKVEKKSKK